MPIVCVRAHVCASMLCVCVRTRVQACLLCVRECMRACACVLKPCLYLGAAPKGQCARPGRHGGRTDTASHPTQEVVPGTTTTMTTTTTTTTMMTTTTMTMTTMISIQAQLSGERIVSLGTAAIVSSYSFSPKHCGGNNKAKLPTDRPSMSPHGTESWMPFCRC